MPCYALFYAHATCLISYPVAHYLAGEFDLSDTSCCGFSGSDSAEHNELKKRRVSRRLLQDSDSSVEHAEAVKQLPDSDSAPEHADTVTQVQDSPSAAHQEDPAQLLQETGVGFTKDEAPGRQLQAGNGCPAAAGPVDGVDWLTVSSSPPCSESRLWKFIWRAGAHQYAP